MGGSPTPRQAAKRRRLNVSESGVGSKQSPLSPTGSSSTPNTGIRTLAALRRMPRAVPEWRRRVRLTPHISVRPGGRRRVSPSISSIGRAAESAADHEEVSQVDLGWSPFQYLTQGSNPHAAPGVPCAAGVLRDVGSEVHFLGLRRHKAGHEAAMAGCQVSGGLQPGALSRPLRSIASTRIWTRRTDR